MTNNLNKMRCILIVCFVALSVAAKPKWHSFVYNERHFRELVLDDPHSDKPITKQATILVKFHRPCHPDFEDITNSKLAPAERLTITYYDENTYEDLKNKWFANEEMGNITWMFPHGGMCLSAMFVHPQKPLTDAMFWIHTSAQPFPDWFWNVAKIEISVKNSYTNNIEVNLEGNGPKVDTQIVTKGDIVAIASYVGYYVTFSDIETGKILSAKMLDWSDNNTAITIEGSYEHSMAVEDYVEQRDLEHEAFIDEMASWRNSLLRMYIQIFKQPIVVSHFSPDGFTLLDLPQDIHNELVQYSKDNSERISGSYSLEPVVNTNTVPVKRLPISNDLRSELTEFFQQPIKDWLSIAVNKTTVGDLYIYSKGSYIRSHVSRMDNYLTAVIVVEAPGANGAIFEILNYDGLWENVRVPVGSVFLYESVSLACALGEPLRDESLSLINVDIKLTEPWGFFADGMNTRILISLGKFNISESFNSYNFNLVPKTRGPKMFEKDQLKTLITAADEEHDGL